MVTRVAAVAAAVLVLGGWAERAQGQTFNLNSGTASWNVPTNWTPNGVPNGSGVAVTFPDAAGGGVQGVTLDAAITIGSLMVTNNSTNIFTLSNGTGGSLTFANGGSEASFVLNGTSGTTNNFTMSAALSLTDTLRVTVNNTSAETALTSSPLTFPQAISGAGGFIKDGPGRMSFVTNTKTYTGPTVINQGRIRLTTSGTPTGTSAVTVNSGGQLNLDTGNGSTGTAFGLGTGGSVLITINGAGTATLPGALRNEGSGTVLTTLSNPVALGSDATIHVDGGTRTLQLDGTVSGSAVLTKTGTGVLVLTNANAGLTGGTIIQDGTITANSTSRIGSGSLTLAQIAGRDTVLNLNNASQAVGNLTTVFNNTSGTRSQTINLNGTALTVNQTGNTTFGNGAVATLTGVIAGTGSLTLSAASTGTLTLTGANTYSGGTTVSGGTLLASNASGSATGSGTVTVNAGGTLGGSGTISGAVTINPNGTIRGGAPGTIGTLTLTADLTAVAGSPGQGAERLQLTVDPTTASLVTTSGRIVFSHPATNDPYVIDIQGLGLTQGTSYTRTVATATGGFFDNAIPLPAGTPFVLGSSYILTSSQFAGFTGVSLMVDGTGQNLILTFTPVPEPGTVLAVGLAGLGLFRLTRSLRSR